MNKYFAFCILLSMFNFLLIAQENSKLPFALHGNIQSDILFPEEDKAIGAEAYNEKALTNTYVDLNLTSAYIEAGTRFEFLKYPLPGFNDAGFAGYGFPFLYATGKYKKVRLTVGDFYDQFGSGFIFRTYEDRSLGIDNSLRGARLICEPYQGILLKALGGTQRRYWEHNPGYVWGGDLELSISQWIKKLEETNTLLTLGGSFISKHEPDEIKTIDASHRLNIPENVGAFDVRARLQKGNYIFLAEYAGKANDPSADNEFIYKNGNALLLSGSYAKNGLSALLQAKRSDNMAFRSKRSDGLNASYINRLPAFTTQQTYALATLYPYATQPGGEWAFQGNFAYTFKKKTPLGGKYGTTLKLNVSHIRSIDKAYVKEYDGTNHSLQGTDGYTSSFFKMGNELYYQDLNVMMDKTITKNFKLNLMYLNQSFNQGVVQGHNGMVYTHLFVAEGKYRINKTLSLRSELQYLQTQQDMGDWVCGLLELSVLPAFMFSLSDMYNAGKTHTHYYKALVTYTYKSHLLQAGYGRTREGYDCSGGICRNVPASRGFTISYNYTF